MADPRDAKARQALPAVVIEDDTTKHVLAPEPMPSHADGPMAASQAILAMWVPGRPRPAQSGRISGKRFIPHATAHRAARLWRERVEREAAFAVEAAGGGDAVEAASGRGAGLWLRLRFVFETEDRRKWGMPHTSRPDGDNLAKLALDALSVGGWFGDDAKAARLEVVKVWGRHAGMGAELRAFRGASAAALDGRQGRPALDDEPDGLPEWLRDAAGDAWVVDHGVEDAD